MADIVITAANVVKGTIATVKPVVFGATITAGKAIVKDPATNKYVLADNNHATAALRVHDGIALNGGGDGQPGDMQVGGDINMGATLTPGVSYWLSDTAGGVCPYADVGSGERAVLVGVATSASNLRLARVDSGTAL
jgi:hypothetical protein